MDVDYVFSSSEQQNKQSIYSEENRDNVSTDVERNNKFIHKTKNIKKFYQPIQEAGKVYHYEDDPQLYKKIRKKIQNRLSARRVRGRKQNAFDSLQHEVEYLRKVNSQLQLTNAKLQTQNKNFKEQLQFMKQLIKTNNLNFKPDPIEKFISPQTFQSENSNKQEHNQYQSPFLEDQSDWIRLPNRRSSSNLWIMMGVFTLILAVFILPSQTNSQSPTVFFSIFPSSSKTQNIQNNWLHVIAAFTFLFMDCIKIGLKYLIIFVYIWFLFKLSLKYLKKSKLKKV